MTGRVRYRAPHGANIIKWEVAWYNICPEHVGKEIQNKLGTNPKEASWRNTHRGIKEISVEPINWENWAQLASVCRREQSEKKRLTMDFYLFPQNPLPDVLQHPGNLFWLLTFRDINISSKFATEDVICFHPDLFTDQRPNIFRQVLGPVPAAVGVVGEHLCSSAEGEIASSFTPSLPRQSFQHQPDPVCWKKHCLHFSFSSWFDNLASRHRLVWYCTCIHILLAVTQCTIF